MEQTEAGWMPLTGPKIEPPQRLFRMPALIMLLSLMIDPELLMVLCPGWWLNRHW